MNTLRDNSQVSTFRNCPLQYKYKYVVGLERQEEGESEHHRNFGKAIHGGLEMLHKGGTTEAMLTAFESLYPEQLDESDLAKTQENGLTLLKAYATRYVNDKDKYKFLDVETRIDFQVGGRDFCVKCDAVVENIKYGGIYSLETKTTGKTLAYKYWDQYNPNHQLDAQTAGVRSKFGECAGVIVNAISFGYRQRKYKEEPAGFHYAFERAEFNRPDAALKQWEISTVQTLEDIENAIEKDRFPANTNACTFCSFKSICAASWSWPEDEDLILLTYQKKANPFDYISNPSSTSDDANNKQKDAPCQLEAT